MRYRAFRRKKDSLFYFQFLSEDDQVLLNSQSYRDKNNCFNGIRSVLNNAGKSGNYEQRTDKNDQHFFVLKAANGQEIGRSRKYASTEALETALAQFIAEGPSSTSKLPEPEAPSKSTQNLPSPTDEPDKTGNARIYKDYKPLAFYEEHTSGLDSGYDSFEADGKYYFAVNHEGSPLLLSEDYESEASRDKGIKSVKKNSKVKKRYEKMVHPNGMHYFNLLAGNNQEIATSRWFEKEKERDTAINWLVSTGGISKSKKSKPAKKSSERIYLRQDQPALDNGITYDTFQSGGNQRYYFVFKDKDGKAILINSNVRGFATEEALNKGVQSLIEYAPLKAHYETKISKNGKHYFSIKNNDGKNVGKSSLFFGSKAEMKEVLSLLQVSGTKVKAAKAPSKKQGKKRSDDYLACEAYTGAEGFHTFQDESTGKHYFAYNDDNGKTFLRSEGYKSASSRDKGIKSVIKNAPQEKRWGTTSVKGSHFYFLKAGNNQEIARSCPYADEAAMLAALTWVQGQDASTGLGAALAGGALMSAAMLKNKNQEIPDKAKIDQTTEDSKTQPEKSDPSDVEKAALTLGAAGLVLGDDKKESTSAEGETGSGEAGITKEEVEEKEAEELKPEEEAALAAAALAAANLKAKEDARIAAEVEADKLKAKEAARLAAEAEEADRKKAGEEAALAAAALAAANLKAAEEARITEAEQQRRAAESAAALAAASSPKQPVGSTVTHTEKKSSGILGWIIPLIIGLLLLLLLLYFMKDCKGCAGAGATDDDTKTEITDENGKNGDLSGDSLSDSNGSANNGGLPGGSGTPADYGKDGKALGFGAGSMEGKIADYLSTGGGTTAKKFWADEIKFNKNKDRLRTAARKQLDNLAVLLKEYPKANIDIYGYINDKENISFKGSKEVTLDDARAKAVYNYLLSRGIEASRLDFFGNGLNDEAGIEISVK